MKTRKGQAAIEFIMTYGWAILVVLAAIGALAYFGVLNPGNFLPDRCTLSAGFSCIEFKVDGSSDDIKIRIQNNLGVDVSTVNVTITGKGSNVACTPAAQSFTNVLNGNALGGGLLTFACGTDITGTKFTGDITIVFIRSGETVDHTGRGSITSNVE